jgi:leader peptidase (prepilin peptidase)/N-methyltransferase
MNALCYLWVAYEFGINGEALLLMAFSSSLIVITFIDLDHQIIPDVISLPGAVVGVLVAPFFMTALADPLPLGLSRFLPDNWPYLNGFVNALFGLLCGALPLLTVGWLWEKLRNIEAMGGGDIKLMAMVGALLGWKGALLTIMLGALTGSVVGMLLILLKRRKADHVIPFGPFLAFGAMTSAFFGPDIVDWYLNFIRL